MNGLRDIIILLRKCWNVLNDPSLRVHPCLLDLSQLLLGHGLHCWSHLVVIQCLHWLLSILIFILCSSLFILQFSFPLGNFSLSSLLAQVRLQLFGFLFINFLSLPSFPRFDSIVGGGLNKSWRSFLGSDLPRAATNVAALGRWGSDKLSNISRKDCFVCIHCDRRNCCFSCFVGSRDRHVEK